LRKSDHNYERARQLRRNLSLPEGLLWRALRRKPSSIKFRRQHPLGTYVLDFYCAQAKLAVEVDGLAHELGDRPERDATRDVFVRAQGIEVLRIPAADVLKSPEEVAEAIVMLCRQRLE
jgi:very-short-patch-repair endonuclease